MVFWCCSFYPYQKVIEELIKLGDTNDMEQLVQSILSFEYKGSNCLFAALEMMQRYSSETDCNKKSDSSIGNYIMFNEIESLFIYMLQLAERNNLDMDRVINKTEENGQSLFDIASLYSEKVSLELITRNVKVNKIDNEFGTPLFRVRLWQILYFINYI